IFTGSTAVGKTVMAAAAENLVPVILELGGKSPALVHPSIDLRDDAQRIAMGRLWFAGQTGVAPDYMYLSRSKTAALIDHFKVCVERMYPDITHNQDYTSIVNDKQYNRLQGYLDDAREQGAHVIEINPRHENSADLRKISPTIVTNVTPSMQIMQHEIFGPLLP